MISRLLHELRHRRVLRSAAGYALLAAAAVEFTDILSDALALPEGILRVVILVALAGLPVVIVLAWFFDLTSDGVVRGDPAPATGAVRGSLAVSWFLVALLGAVAVYLGARLYGEGQGGGAARSLEALTHGKSIAVLPLSSIASSTEPDSRYFGDGIAQEIISALSRLEGLRVAAPSSSFGFRDSADARTVGEALNVSTVLEGSVRRAGDRLRVTAQLVDARDGFQLWAEVYDYGVEDVFRVQEDIARAIVDALQVELLGPAPARMVDQGTQSVEAYDLYLRGRDVLRQRTPASARDAIALFEEALRNDEDYARAWTGLADAWIALREVGNLPLFEATQNSHSAITRALQLDSTLPEAQASLGLCILGGGDYEDAARQFQRAIDLDPEFVDGYLLRANLMRDRGYLAEATRSYSQALALDAYNPAILENQAVLYALQGRFEEARAQLASVRAEHPDRVTAALAGARVEGLAGDYEAALRQADAASDLVPDSPLAQAARVLANARLGRLEAAGDLLALLRNVAPDNETVGDTTLRYFLMMGDFQSLDALASERGGQVVGAPGFEGTPIVHDRALWMALARLGLEDAAGARTLLEGILAAPASLDPTPRNVHALALLARARSLDGDAEGAATAATAALDLAGRAADEGRAGGDLHYARAAAEAARGATDAARAHLDRALAAGWRDWGRADHDPAIAALAADDAYRALAGRE